MKLVAVAALFEALVVLPVVVMVVVVLIVVTGEGSVTTPVGLMVVAVKRSRNG